ncbi:MAG: hypothetical protein HQK57_00105 [Deltaproteobacteria bacterium]|nr:hypothetical protein [Deltaproteobacteria bacterium]
MAQGLKALGGFMVILFALFACFIFAFANRGLAAEDQPAVPSAQSVAPVGGTATDCPQLAEQLQQQKNLISREAGQLKRELAALREDISKPGLKEVFAGIGYIFGLAGIGIYVNNRRRT